MNFFDRLKQLRHHLGLTQAQFAKDLGVQQRTISNWETGRNEPNIDILALIIAKWAVNINWLITGLGDMFTNGLKDISSTNQTITGDNNAIGNNNSINTNTQSKLKDSEKDLLKEYKKLPEKVQEYYFYQIKADALKYEIGDSFE